MESTETRDLHVETVVDAPPGRVWELLTDLDNMSAWSPETVRMIPLKPGGLRAGQWYLGINRRGPVVWPTRSVVAELADGRRIAWDTRTSGARWIWDLEPADSGTRVVHQRMMPGGVPPLARAFAGAFLHGVGDHTDALEGDMQVTVDALKRAAEGS